MSDPVFEWREVGADLRRMRKDADVTQRQAADAIKRDQAVISNIEGGRRPPTAAELVLLFQLYRAPTDVQGPMLDRVRALSVDPQDPDRIQVPKREEGLRRYIRLERQSVRVDIYEAELIPGLLQTEGYARALIGSFGRLFKRTDDWVSRQASLRMSRQSTLEKDHPAKLNVVLGEAALRRPVGGREVFQGQVGHLLRMSKRRNITIRLLPFEVGEHAALGASFTLYWGPGRHEPGMCLIDNVTHPVYIKQPDQVHAHKVLFDHVHEAALTAEASRDWMEEVMAE